MHYREKRDNIRADKKDYTIIRILSNHPDYHLYIATANNQMHTIREYKLKENFDEASKNIKLLNRMDVNVPVLEAINDEEYIIIREYIQGSSACDLLLSGQLRKVHLELIRDMAIDFEKSGLSLDYFPSNFIVNGNDIVYIGTQIFVKNDENCFDKKGADFFLNPAKTLLNITGNI